MRPTIRSRALVRLARMAGLRSDPLAARDGRAQTVALMVLSEGIAALGAAGAHAAAERGSAEADARMLHLQLVRAGRAPSA